MRNGIQLILVIIATSGDSTRPIGNWALEFEAVNFSFNCPFPDDHLLPVSIGDVKLNEVSGKSVLRCQSYRYLVG